MLKSEDDNTHAVLIEKLQKYPEDIQSSELRLHESRVLVSKSFEFDAAHHLHEYEGKCRTLHGHRWKIVFYFVGLTDYRGITVDFTHVKKIWKAYLEPQLDHQYLNLSLPKMNPTCENIVVWAHDKMRDYFDSLVCTRLYETPSSYAEFPVWGLR